MNRAPRFTPFGVVRILRDLKDMPDAEPVAWERASKMARDAAAAGPRDGQAALDPAASPTPS